MERFLRFRAASKGVALALSFLLPIVLANAVSAAPGDTSLASTSDDGTKGGSDSFDASLSADGRTVAFDSFAANLDPADPDDLADIFVKDLDSGNLTLASAMAAGTKGDMSSFEPFLSADGTAVAFTSLATNLDPADTDASFDIYVKDLIDGSLVLASSSDGGVKGNSDSLFPSLSKDGGKVAFYSSSTNLDEADLDPSWDVYVKDLATGEIALASTADGGLEKGNDQSADPSLSADGTHVSFWSYASNLDPADADGSADVFVKDLVDGDITLASTSDRGVKGNDHSYATSLSADGTRVAFFSYATNLDAADADSAEDVYVKDLVSGALTLASTSDDGTKGDAGSTAPSLSGDGVTVSFESNAANLDPGHTDNSWDVYVKDLLTGELTLASSPDSFRPSLSANGAFVAFESSSMSLDPADTDTLADIYVRELGPAPIEADLEVTVSDTPDPVASGHFLTYLITVTNRGGSDATGVTLVDVIDDAKLRSVTASQGSCTEGPRGGTVNCALGSLSDDAVATVEIVVRAVRPKSSPITNTATVSGNEPDPVPENNTATETTTIGAS
jgi:uncharacterized repeat protein (TIGR01451 family)